MGSPEPVEHGRAFRPRLAITQGDPNGIGPEVVLKALADRRITRYLKPLLIGSAQVFKYYQERYGLDAVELQEAGNATASPSPGGTEFIDIQPREKGRVVVGQATRAGGHLAMEAVQIATDLAINGEVDAVVTAPISKRAIAMAGFDFPGHTEYLASRTEAKQVMMIMVAGDLRVGLVTGHTPLQLVAEGIKLEAVKRSIARLGKSLVQDFGISRPRIAVLGLNPHAGEDGVLGKEETNRITPAIRQSCAAGWLAFGPFPADGFFGAGSFRQYDAVLAMYHDQGLAPFKALAFHEGVNFTAGLPIVRTSPDHGTAFNIAGKGIASPRSLRQALFTAVDIARNRHHGQSDS